VKGTSLAQPRAVRSYPRCVDQTELEEARMGIVGGFDVHRKRIITYDST
jgi:hypothetical protein